MKLRHDILRRGPVVAKTDDVRLEAVERVRHELVVHLGAVDALPNLRHTPVFAVERKQIEGEQVMITMRSRTHRGGSIGGTRHGSTTRPACANLIHHLHS